MSASRIRWGYASNEEGPFTGDFDTREEAVAEGLSATEDDPVWVVSGVEHTGWRYMPSADHILEQMNDLAYDNGGDPDYFDGFDVSEEAASDLAKLLRAWADKHVPWAVFWESSGCGPAECVREGGAS